MAARRSIAAPTVIGPPAPSAAGSSYVGRRPVLAPVAGREPPPRPVEIDQDLLDGVPSSARASAIAVPDTTETSCSADGPPSRTTTGGRAVWRSHRSWRGLPAGPVADELDLEAEVDAVAGEDLGPDPLRQATDVRGTPLLVVDDEVGVLLRDDGATDPRALEPGRLDQPPGRVAVRVAEDAARRGQAEWLVGLTPVADLVEPVLDRLGVRLGQPERGVDDDVARRALGAPRRPP